MAYKKTNARKRAWWTRERIILGLHRFYSDFGFCATSSEAWAEKTQIPGRVGSAVGKYPSFATILLHWPTFRQAWEAAGHQLDRSWEEWSELEDWYILETVGIIPRSEVAKDTRRSEPAIKRRLYDLGDIRSYNRWGMTLSHAAALMEIGQTIIQKYMKYGDMPFLKGNKCYFLNPADLTMVLEYNWDRPDIPEELDQAIRRAQAQRIAKILKYGAEWRRHEVYTFQPVKRREDSRYKVKREISIPKELPPVPNDMRPGMWITTAAIPRKIRAGRKGKINYIYWTPQRSNNRPKGYQDPCWMARVEFPKLRLTKTKEQERYRVTLPVGLLIKTEAPQPDPKPLKMNEEAVRSRGRWKERQAKTPVRWNRVKDLLS